MRSRSVMSHHSKQVPAPRSLAYILLRLASDTRRNRQEIRRLLLSCAFGNRSNSSNQRARPNLPDPTAAAAADVAAERPSLDFAVVGAVAVVVAVVAVVAAVVVVLVCCCC